MHDNILKNKSYSFSIRIIKLSQYLIEKKQNWVLSKQVLRSGTAIGALVRESEFAERTADFVHKLHIALKEAGETDYWLSLLKDTDYITAKMYDSIAAECRELIKILTASIKTIKSKKGNLHNS
jgi:four helix bundle protein